MMAQTSITSVMIRLALRCGSTVMDNPCHSSPLQRKHTRNLHLYRSFFAKSPAKASTTPREMKLTPVDDKVANGGPKTAEAEYDPTQDPYDPVTDACWVTGEKYVLFHIIRVIYL